MRSPAHRFLPRTRTFSLSLLIVSVVACAPALAQQLALKRVMLSTGGLGYYEYEAEVDGDTKLKLTVGLDQVDDVLKSLVVYDDKGGIGGLDLPSREPLSQTFRNLPFGQQDLQSTEALLHALQGAEVSVGGAHTVTGRILAVAEEKQTGPGDQTAGVRHRVSLMTADGLAQFVLEDADHVQFTDPALQAQINQALGALAANHAQDSRTLELSSKGTDKRKVRVAYIVQAPLWKASYRLVLPADMAAKQATVQGWATVENLSGQDWTNVDLTLISGQPVTFKQALYRTYLVDRPEAPVEVVGRLLPNLDQGEIGTAHTNQASWGVNAGVSVNQAVPLPAGAYAGGVIGGQGDFGYSAGKQRAAPANAAVPSSLAQSNGTITAQEGLTQVVFHLPAGVSVGNGRTLSVPIINGAMPIERLSLYQPGVNARHPLSTVKLTNDGKTGIPPGIVTIFEQAPDGVAYVGDSRLSDLPSGDYRFLSYALDQKLTIERSESQVSKVTRGLIVKGVVKYDTRNEATVTYKIKATEPRNLIVEEAKRNDWKLADPQDKNITEIEGKYRIPFAVKAADAQSFTDTQEMITNQQFRLIDATDDALRYFIDAPEFGQDMRGHLAHLAELRAAVANVQQRIQDIDSRTNAIGQEQDRIRGNLPSIPTGSDLQKRYLSKLNDQETELETLGKQRNQETNHLNDARQAVADYIAQL